MNLPEKHELLQRYHDGEVNAEEAREVEALLTKSGEALDFLGHLDAMREIAQEANERVLADVSFDGLWGEIQSHIEAQTEKAPAATQPREEVGIGAWLRSLFVDHKSAWVTAGATAFAVAVVLVAFQAFNTNDDGVQKVVEKHFVYIDSVDKTDPDSTVLVNSMQDDGTAVIWLLPNAEEQNGEEDTGDEGVVIEEEPL